MKDLDLLRETMFYILNEPDKELDYRIQLIEKLRMELSFLESHLCTRYYNMYKDKIICDTTRLENEITTCKSNIINLFLDLYKKMLLSYSDKVLKPKKCHFSIKKFMKDLFKKN